jgi:acetolactate synthase-1/2/3 large subunit
LGAAIGVKLARPDAEVACLVGDGSFLLGAPSAALWTSRQCAAPFLTVVYNNEGWAAVRDATLRQHPAGYAARHRDYSASFGEGVDLSAVARAVGGYGERVRLAGEVPAALQRGRDAVRRGQPAVIDVLIAPVGGRGH